ncbi:unnamed protein product [Leptidea sinapis]|uniref:Uncharacterized protein n=2 Tax=Leptidea sinapis TaxID=189913 RepID=A0A5E4PVZ5_9NEOP|nr:unnamed protein product [Leptidea sinapis]
MKLTDKQKSKKHIIGQVAAPLTLTHCVLGLDNCPHTSEEAAIKQNVIVCGPAAIGRTDAVGELPDVQAGHTPGPADELSHRLEDQGYCEDEPPLRHRCVRAHGGAISPRGVECAAVATAAGGRKECGGRSKLRAASAGAAIVTSACPRARRGLDSGWRFGYR